ncbi:type II toxin-antitoxin system HicA family toxin [Jiella mangrovi]|uniref:Type II toxin-antitoxin system HicA family toxin n=1 Tax=Jiella mangrovi TaxID=2821407 RepID=A0ABS4BM08_9HYPH|nr:type II toxin-antitoxin system HicA family toxin [Jiella mangrovi]MBP0617256.1 type II toxin-antitoxin system HicA family toxin [Jiella mangrovi]
MNRRQRKLLDEIFANPTSGGIAWRDIEALLVAMGADVSEGSGSRVRVALGGARAVFHRPHPQKETSKGAIRSLQRFLEEAGRKP